VNSLSATFLLLHSADLDLEMVMLALGNKIKLHHNVPQTKTLFFLRFSRKQQKKIKKS
jgi:hypothetical protein